MHYCYNCGKKNNKDAVYCNECGKNLNPEKFTNEGGIRKNIKKYAKSIIDMKVIGITSIYLIIYILFNSLLYLVEKKIPTTILEGISLIIYSFIFSALFYSIIYFGISKIKDKKLKFKDILLEPFKKYKNLLNITVLLSSIRLLNFFITDIVLLSNNIILYIIYILYYVLYIITMIYFIPTYFMSICILVDDNKKQEKKFSNYQKAKILINNHRVEFYGLIFSFVGLIILLICTIGLLSIWLIPYMILSITCLYSKLMKEKKFNEPNIGPSNGMIIGTTLSLFGLIMIILFIILSIFTITISISYASKGVYDASKSVEKNANIINKEINKEMKKSFKETNKTVKYIRVGFKRVFREVDGATKKAKKIIKVITKYADYDNDDLIAKAKKSEKKKKKTDQKQVKKDYGIDFDLDINHKERIITNPEVEKKDNFYNVNVSVSKGFVYDEEKNVYTNKLGDKLSYYNDEESIEKVYSKIIEEERKNRNIEYTYIEQENEITTFDIKSKVYFVKEMNNEELIKNYYYVVIPCCDKTSLVFILETAGEADVKKFIRVAK